MEWDWQQRRIKMAEHSKFAQAHLEQLLEYFMSEDDEEMFEETAKVIDGVVLWLQEEAPWL